MTCADCRQPRQPHYRHVHMVVKLPTERTTEDRKVTRGYAVEVFGEAGLGPIWLFFADLEPAVAFARSARMSFDVGSCEIHEAAAERRCDPAVGGDVQSLYVASKARPNNHGTDVPVLERWIKGVHPDSNSYLPPRRRHT